jgi:hypothetical protein
MLSVNFDAKPFNFEAKPVEHETRAARLATRGFETRAPAQLFGAGLALALS